jgi:excisionase family DNA binding protein
MKLMLLNKTKYPVAETARLLTVEEFADARRCSSKTVRRRIAEKKLPVIRTGRLIHIHPRFLHLDL